MEFSVRQASSCDQSDWSEKEAAKTPWKPVVVFGCSNHTGIDTTRGLHNKNKSCEHCHECLHGTRAIVHIHSVAVIYVAMSRKRVSKKDMQLRHEQAMKQIDNGDASF